NACLALSHPLSRPVSRCLAHTLILGPKPGISPGQKGRDNHVSQGARHVTFAPPKRGSETNSLPLIGGVSSRCRAGRVTEGRSERVEGRTRAAQEGAAQGPGGPARVRLAGEEE